MKSLQDIKSAVTKGVRALEGGGYSVSQPVPCMENGLRTERVFFYPNTFNTKRVRPYAWASISSEHGRVFSFQYCAVRDFMDTKQYPLEQMVDYSVPSAKSAREQGELLKRMEEACEAVRAFAFAETLDEAQMKQLREFSLLMAQTVPAGLMPYYEALSPDFFRWMKAQTA